jgi:hypothetical protein
MGSLILLLLVIDRRAKAVARAKALRALEQAAAGDAKEEEARRAEWERRRRVIHEQLAQEDREVLGKLQRFERQSGEATAKIEGEQRRRTELNERLESEQSRLRQSEKVLLARRTELSQAAQQTEASQAEMARLTTELEHLEQALRDLKALRQQQRQLYSLVPYQGKRGDNRRPIYIECAANALILHPDRHTLSGDPLLFATALRSEIEKRMDSASSKTDARAKTPYLLMLIRPGGINTYYRALAALQGMQVDFGYEFIDQDWMLDFPQDDTAGRQPWMVAAAVERTAPNTVPPKKVTGFNPAQIGQAQLRPSGGAFAGDTSNQNLSTSPTLVSTEGGGRTGNPSAAKPPAWAGEAGRIDNPSYGRASPWPSPAGGPAGGGVSIAPPVPIGDGEGSSGQGQVPSELGRDNSPEGRGGSSPGDSALAARGNQSRGTDAGEPAAPGGATNALPALFPSPVQPPGDQGRSSEGNAIAARRGTGESSGAVTPSSGQTGSQASQSSGSSSGTNQGQEKTNAAGTRADSAGAEAGPQTGGDAPGPALPDRLQRLLPRDTPKAAGRTGPNRPLVLVGNRDWLIFVDCKADGLTLSPLGQHIAASAIGRNGNGVNPLQESVEQLITRRQASVRPGEPPYRPLIRFRVYPDGLRSYYLAYPALEALGVPMSRENVE